MAQVQSGARSNRTTLAYFMAGLFLFLAAILLLFKSAFASHIAYDPYADSVAGTAAAVLDANNAVGAPNGTNAQLAGVASALTLDMGAGEEGTQTLRVYFGQINVQANVEVQFLDNNQSVIASESRQLGVDINPVTQNFGYNWTSFGKAYRYVRIVSNIGGGVNVDAVEALGYIGSSEAQDTDGDGRTDRSEQHNGTNPLVADPAPGSGQSSSPPGSGSGGSSSVPGQVNQPPGPGNDQDGDGIADDWERAHGLDPANPNDRDADADHDGLSNALEFQLNSDPQRLDTDGDGMPDKWEYENGLDPNKNDADGDPDGDFLTNLGEYRHGTDPHKANDLYELFAKACAGAKGMKAWDWLLFALLLLGALASWLVAAGVIPRKKHKSSRKTEV